MIDPSEHREHPRVYHEESVSVKVRKCDGDPSLAGRVFPCSSRDASINGLCLHLDHEVPVGALLDLTVVVVGLSRTFELRGEVRWMRSEGEAKYAAGIELLAKPKEEVAAWRDIVRQKIRFMND